MELGYLYFYSVDLIYYYYKKKKKDDYKDFSSNTQSQSIPGMYMTEVNGACY